MTDDLVKRLRANAEQEAMIYIHSWVDICRDFSTAADRIEALEAQIESAVMAAVETQPSWGWRISRVMSALGLDFGDPEDIDSSIARDACAALEAEVGRMRRDLGSILAISGAVGVNAADPAGAMDRLFRKLFEVARIAAAAIGADKEQPPISDEAKARIAEAIKQRQEPPR